MSGQALSDEKLRALLDETRNQIDDVKLYYELKKRRLVRGNQSLENIKTLFALTKLHLPITTASFCWAMQRNSGAIGTLHGYGDKNMLVWKREFGTRGLSFEWILSPFMVDLMAYIWKE